MEVLAEIKALLKDYAEKNGRYEKLIALDKINLDNYKDSGTELMDILCLLMEH